MSNFETDHPINRFDPTELDATQEKALAEVAIELRRQGLSLEEWQAFLDKSSRRSPRR